MNRWIRLATISFAGIVFSIVALIFLQSMAGFSGTQSAHGGNTHPSDVNPQQISYSTGHSAGAVQTYGYSFPYGQQVTAYDGYGTPYSGYAPGHTAGVAQNYGYPVHYAQPHTNAYYGNPYPGYQAPYHPAGAYGNMPQSYQLQQQQLLELKQHLLEMKAQLNNMNMNQGGMTGNSIMPMVPMMPM